MVPAALPLLTSRDRDEARRLVESQGLSFEDGCDDVVGIYDEGRLVATAARAGYVLKMFAIDDGWQGGETLGQLVTTLVDLGRRAGHESLFVYTRPANAASFEACNFRLLVACGEVALLEYGGGLEEYLHAKLELRATPEKLCATPEESAGAVVINGNPFTLGHQYLVETAAARVARLYLFVVREDRSVFPVRRPLRAGPRRRCAPRERGPARHVALRRQRGDLSRRTSCGSTTKRRASRWKWTRGSSARTSRRRSASRGASSATSPTATPPRAYNAALERVLPEYGVALEIVPRAGDATGAFSATRVRAALAAGDWETVARLVPEPTLALLRSRDGATLTRRLGMNGL